MVKVEKGQQVSRCLVRCLDVRHVCANCMYCTVLNITRSIFSTSESLMKCWLGLIYTPVWDSDHQQKNHPSVARPESNWTCNLFKYLTREKLKRKLIQLYLEEMNDSVQWFGDCVPWNYVATKNQLLQNFLRTQPEWKTLQLPFTAQPVQGSTGNIIGDPQMTQKKQYPPVREVLLYFSPHTTYVCATCAAFDGAQLH